MTERWTHPPLVAEEPPAPWRARWRFRLVTWLLLAVLVGLGVLAYRQLSGAAAEDPGVSAAALMTARQAAAAG